MGNEVQVSQNAKGHDICGYTENEISAIKRALNFNMSNEDLHIFLHICRHTKLDPLARQIYAIPRGGKMTIQTSIDGFRLIADRSGCYAPGRPTEFVWDDKGNLVAAKAYVKKLSGGEWHEIGETAVFREYAGTTPFWKKMPSVMLSKVAEARALRRAFPADLSGLYTSDEMDQSQPDIIVKEEPKPVLIDQEQVKQIEQLIGDDAEIRKMILDRCNGEIANIQRCQFAGAMQVIERLVQQKEEATKENGEK